MTVSANNDIKPTVTANNKAIKSDVTASQENTISTTTENDVSTTIGDVIVGNNTNISDVALCAVSAAAEPSSIVTTSKLAKSEVPSLEASLSGNSTSEVATIEVQPAEIASSIVYHKPITINYNQINIININSYSRLSICGNAFNIDNMKAEGLGQMILVFKTKDSISNNGYYLTSPDKNTPIYIPMEC
ncbi:MAG: hypothetical protein AB8W37_10920 [Arsenophonus endosymbiont of Dermacentor nuttalli]